MFFINESLDFVNGSLNWFNRPLSEINSLLSLLNGPFIYAKRLHFLINSLLEINRPRLIGVADLVLLGMRMEILFAE